MKKPIIITITGGSGSGKGALAEAVIKTLGEERVSTISHDMYYHPYESFPKFLQFEMSGNKMMNFDHPDALETAKLESDLEKLLTGEEIQIPNYDFGNNETGKPKRTEGKIIKPTEFIIVEGIFVLQSKKLAEELSDLNIFLEVSDVNLMARRFIRDWGQLKPTRNDMGAPGMWDDMLFYINYVQKGYDRFVKPYKNRADLIVDNNQWIKNGEEPKMIEMVTHYLGGRFKI